MVRDSKIDKGMIVVVILLVMFGLIMVYSASMILAKEKFGDSYYFLKKQAIWLLLGFTCAAVIACLKYPIYLKPGVVFTVLALALIGLVLVFFVGKINNSYRWIRWGGFSLQPSEFAKIAAVLYLSYILSRKTTDVNDIPRLLLQLSPFFAIELLILKEPDVGNFFIILMTGVVLLFIAGLKIRYFLYASLLLTPALYIFMKMHPAKMIRILAFLKPDAYATTHNFQSLQSQYAIGSGGIFGKGLGNSTQKLYFLPYAYSDFIYAIIGEEAGLVGALVLVGLFMVFLRRGLTIARFSGDLHSYLLVTSLSFLIVMQAMLHVSVSLGIFPTKGIPLPFISNGGSSLIATLMMVGIILNVSRHRKTVLIND